MKKLIPLIAIIPMLLLALTPPWEFKLDCTVNSLAWLWAVLLSGFLAFLFVYQKVSVWLKLLVIWCFISCFISRAPFISFTMYWSVIVSAYYYALCKKIDNWESVHKTIQAIFYLTVLLVIMQLFGKDTLLNFKHANPLIIGTIGNKMMTSSFMCILAPFLILTPLMWIPLALVCLITGSSGGLLALYMGGASLLWVKCDRALKWIISILFVLTILYASFNGDIKTFFSKAGRGPVYIKTLELSLKRPLGYGIGTYKVLFPYMCGAEIRDQAPGQEWNTTHNTFLQLLFETGFVGFFLMLGWVASIVLKVLKHKNYVKLAGLVILASCMMTQFPDRMCQTVLIIIMFLAYCEKGDGIWVR